MKNKTLWFMLVLFITFFTEFAGAENRQLGRLADGRAYRIAADGSEIVDYIAELELTNQGLRDQIQGLENELIERKRLFETASNGVAIDSPKISQLEQQVHEFKNALSQEQIRSNSLQSQLVDLKSAYVAQEQDLDLMRELHRDSLDFQQKQEVNLSNVATQRNQALKDKESVEQEFELIKADKARYKEQLETLELERTKYEKQIEQLQTLELERSKYKKQTEQLQTLELERAKYEKQLAELSSKYESQLTEQCKDYDKEVAVIREQMRSTKQELANTKEALRQYEVRASFRPERTNVSTTTNTDAQVKKLVSQFKKAYAEVKRLSERRDNLYEQLASQRTGVTLSKVRPKSRRGVSLTYLSKRVNKITREPSSIKLFYPDVLDLKRRLASDVELAERLLAGGS